MGELAAILAMHFEQAGEKEKAIHYLTAAASFAYERNAIVESFDLYGRAAALLPQPSDEDNNELLRRRVEIRLGRAKSGLTFMSDVESLGELEPAVSDAERLGDLRLEADVHITIAFLRQFKGDAAESSEPLRRSLDRVAQIAKELDDPLIAALPDSIVGLFRVFTGDLQAGVTMLERAAPQLELKNDFVGSSFALVALAIGYARMGDFAAAEDAARRAKRLAEKGDLIARLDSLIAESTVSSIRGDLDAAVPLAMQCTSLAEETGAIACVVASNTLLGDAFMRQGRFIEAKIALERGNDVALSIEDRQFRPSITAYLRSNAASLGELTDAAGFDEALELARHQGDHWGVATVVWQRAETESKRSDGGANVEQMLVDYAAAAAAYEGMGGRPYLARVLRDWGNALRIQGQIDESDARLRRALNLFTELGIQREANEVHATLGLG